VPKLGMVVVLSWLVGALCGYGIAQIYLTPDAINPRTQCSLMRSDKRGQAMGSPQELIQSNRVSRFVAPRIFPRSFDTPSSRPDA
jgi:hypothetical protein